MRWFLNFVIKVLRRCWRIFLFFISLPISAIIIVLFPFYKIKFLKLFSDRIGHYAVNTELLLCYLDQIKQHEKRTKYFFYISDAPICNASLHSMWKRVIPIVSMTKIAGNVDRWLLRILSDRYKSSILRKFEVPDGYQDIENNLQKNKQHLSFTKDEMRRGEKLLSQLRIPVNSKWVCLLVRDSAYLDKYLPGLDWSHHFYRDCDIKNFEKASLFLADRGYYVIRMGKAVSNIFHVSHKNIIDYANHPLRSDAGDIYLSAHCTFFISTSTGLDAVAQIFRKPVMMVNIAPFKFQLQYWFPLELFITKKVYDKKNNRFLSFREIDDTIPQQCDVRKVAHELNYEIVENTEDEILALVSEMESRLNQNFLCDVENKFHDFLKTDRVFSMIMDRNLLRSSPEKCYIRIGEAFLKENYALFL